VDLSQTLETLNVLGDESRLRLCALLAGRELCVTDLVRVTGISQSRVSTHLGRLRDAGFVRDRRQGAQSFYGLAAEGLPLTARSVLDQARGSADPTLAGDRRRLLELESERRQGVPDAIAEDVERDYAPGRTWQSLAVGMAALLDLGDVLNLGAGNGAAANVIAPSCRTLTCLDRNPRQVEAARERLAKHPHVRCLVGDGHQLPFAPSSFDAVLVFHTLTYAERPARVLEECARVLRPGGRIVVLCLDHHDQHEVTARYGERHPGFSPRTLRGMLARAGLDVRSCEVASRETKKPHLQVLLALAEHPASPHPSTHTPRKKRLPAV